MDHVPFDDTRTRNWTDYGDDARQIEAFRRLDFGTAMAGEVAKVITSADGIQERYFALVRYFCERKSAQYKKRPTRRFKAGTGRQAAKLDDVYRASKIDALMCEAQEISWSQNSVVMAVDPHPRDPRRVCGHVFNAGDVWVEADDPSVRDIRDATRVTLRWPVLRERHMYSGAAGLVGTDTVTYGRRIYTQNEAWIEAPGNSERKPIFGNSVDHGLGFIPLVGLRQAGPELGWWLPALPLDLLSVQLGLIIAVSDIEQIARLKCPGRELLTGEGATHAAKNMDAGPEGVWSFEGGDGLAYQAVSIDPRIDRYIQAVELQVKLLAQYRHLNPEGLWASTGITGAAKEVERAHENEEREAQEILWQDAEQDLVELVAAVAKTGPSALTVRGPRVDVEYHYPQARQNDLQAMQALALGSALGVTSNVEHVSLRDGVPATEASDRVADNLASWQQTLESWKDSAGVAQAPPGVEAMAAQLIR